MSKHLATTTQELHPWKAVFRTALQLVLGLALSAPLIVAAITGGDPEVVGGAFAVFLAISAAITRLMAVPLINGWLSWIGLGADKRGKNATVDLNVTGEHLGTTRE